MVKWWNALLIVSSVLIASASAAQEICVSTPENLAAAKRAIAEINSASRPGLVQKVQGVLQYLDEQRRQLPEFPPKRPMTPFDTPVEPYMYGQLGQSQTPAEVADAPPETRFGWWGYRHAELHADGVIAELVEKSKPTNCCNGVWKGECRVTRYVTNGVGPRMVLIDGMVCPINPNTKIVQLNRFMEADTVVLCANKTVTGNPYTAEQRKCPDTFCLGGGKIGG